MKHSPTQMFAQRLFKLSLTHASCLILRCKILARVCPRAHDTQVYRGLPSAAGPHPGVLVDHCMPHRRAAVGESEGAVQESYPCWYCGLRSVCGCTVVRGCPGHGGSVRWYTGPEVAPRGALGLEGRGRPSFLNPFACDCTTDKVLVRVDIVIYGDQDGL